MSFRIMRMSIFYWSCAVISPWMSFWRNEKDWVSSKFNISYYKLYKVYNIFTVQGWYTESILSANSSLKLGNLMLSDNMELKIGDFGLAAKLESYN